MNSLAVKIRENDDELSYALMHTLATPEVGSILRSKEIANINSKAMSERHLTYGSGYQSDQAGQMNALSTKPEAHVNVRRHSLSSEVKSELSAQDEMQFDLIQAAGSMTADIKEDIAAIITQADILTIDQKMKFVEVVFNTYQLQQVNDGRIALSTAEIEKLANDTLDTMRELAQDLILPEGLKAVSLDTIKTSAQIFQISDLDAAIVKFESDTSPQSILDNSIEALKATLMELLDQDDLSDEYRQEIEDTLEKLDALESGEPIPAEILKSLETFVTELNDGNLSSELSAMIATLSNDVENVRQASVSIAEPSVNLSDRKISLKSAVAEAVMTFSKPHVPMQSSMPNLTTGHSGAAIPPLNTPNKSAANLITSNESQSTQIQNNKTSAPSVTPIFKQETQWNNVSLSQQENGLAAPEVSIMKQVQIVTQSERFQELPENVQKVILETITNPDNLNKPRVNISGNIPQETKAPERVLLLGEIKEIIKNDVKDIPHRDIADVIKSDNFKRLPEQTQNDLKEAFIERQHESNQAFDMVVFDPKQPLKLDDIASLRPEEVKILSYENIEKVVLNGDFKSLSQEAQDAIFEVAFGNKEDIIKYEEERLDNPSKCEKCPIKCPTPGC